MGPCTDEETRASRARLPEKEMSKLEMARWAKLSSCPAPASIMAEKPPAQDAVPASGQTPAGSKPSGNPVFRMMGRSVTQIKSLSLKLMLGCHRSSQFQVEASIPKLVDLLDCDWLFHSDPPI